MDIWMIFILYGIIMIPSMVFMAITPYISRKTESFGISIPSDVYQHPEVEGLRRSYRNRVLGICLAAISVVLMLMFILKSSEVNIISIMIFIASFIPVYLLYFSGHRKMKAMKAKYRWGEDRQQILAIETNYHGKKLLVSPFWFLFHVAAILGTLALGVMLFDGMPERIPIHYDIIGNIDKYVDKNFKLIFFVPAIQFIITALIAVLYFMIGKAKQQLDSQNPEMSSEQSRRFRYIWSAFIVSASFVLVILFALMQLFFTGVISDPGLIDIVMIAGVGLLVISAIIVSVYTGQGGSRLKTSASGKGGTINRNDDCYWKLGAFYYNPEDPALFLAKRFGIGWTLNFGHWISWIILLGLLIGLPLLTQLISKVLT